MPETRLTRDGMEALLKRMATTKVVVVGDAMLDVYLVGEVDRVSPEAPVPVVTVHASRHGLGGAANVAANVAALGADCRLVAVVGEDQRGQSVRAELDDLKLNSSFLITDTARPTTSKTRVVARGQQMLRIDEEIEDPISAKVMEKLGRSLERALEDADALLIEDYNKGTLVPQVIERGMTIAKRRSLPVVVDPKFKNFFAYRGATVFKPNRRELELAMGAALDLYAASVGPVLVDFLEPEEGSHADLTLKQATDAQRSANTATDVAFEVTTLRPYYEQWLAEHDRRTGAGISGIDQRRFLPRVGADEK